MADESTSKTNETLSGSSVGGAASEAGQTARGAAAQTAGTQAGAAAVKGLAEAETTADIGTSEAYIVNMKRLVDIGLNLDAALQANASRVIRNAEDFDAQVKQIALQNLQLGQTALANAVALANRVNNDAIDGDVRAKGNDESQDKQMDACSVSERERTVRVGDIANDRQWNIDEVAALISNVPVFKDIVAAAAAAAAVQIAKGQQSGG